MSANVLFNKARSTAELTSKADEVQWGVLALRRPWCLGFVLAMNALGLSFSCWR